MLKAVAAGTLGSAAAIAADAYAQVVPAVANKVPKAAAQYQDKPSGNQMCGSCTFFVSPSSCQRVDGEVHPTGWCKFFQQRK